MCLTYQCVFIGSVKKEGGGNNFSVTSYVWGMLRRIRNLHTRGDPKESIEYTLWNDF